MMTGERRSYRRLNLRWRLRLKGHAGLVDARTENLSSRGFYCFLDSPLVPGDMVTCTITIPNHSTENREACSIVCQAEVARVEAIGPTPTFGVAFRIVDFTLDRHLALFDN